MTHFLRPFAAICLCGMLTCATAVAETTNLHPKTVSGGLAKKARTPHPAGRPTTVASPAAANLNAPATDFSNVEPETGEPRRGRQHGPTVRPGLDSSGHPTMGLGF